MKQSSQMQQLFRVGVTVAFITLAFLGTAVIRIPIPASGGYFNLGDTFVMAAALLYGPLVGGAVGMVGPALADAVGFPQFILATGVVKGIEGLLIGLLTRGNPSTARILLSLAAGIVVLVGGYYIFEAHIYPLLARQIPFFWRHGPRRGPGRDRAQSSSGGAERRHRVWHLEGFFTPSGMIRPGGCTFRRFKINRRT